jgi:hypothetical protein
MPKYVDVVESKLCNRRRSLFGITNHVTSMYDNVIGIGSLSAHKPLDSMYLGELRSKKLSGSSLINTLIST